MTRRSLFSFLAAPFLAPLARFLPSWAKPVVHAKHHADGGLDPIHAAIFRDIYWDGLAEAAQRDVWILEHFKHPLKRFGAVHWTVPDHADPEILS